MKDNISENKSFLFQLKQFVRYNFWTDRRTRHKKSFVVLHALSSYKDHPYKDQVVHFRKNKDQYK